VYLAAIAAVRERIKIKTKLDSL